METYWIPGVNNRGDFGRWSFAELTDVWEMEHDFAAKLEKQFGQMVSTAGTRDTVTVG